MIKQNMHIHSKYSWDCEKDGKMEIEEIAKILLENGIKYGAITDHIEFDMEPLPYVLTKFKIRNLEIDRINELYQGKITLLKAAEISEPHLYKYEVEALNELDLDFLMGSIHKIKMNSKTDSDKIHANYLYYSEMLKMVEANQIDVVAHLDYINRYYGRCYSSYYQVSDLIAAIIENDQIIEINTSGKRRANLDLFPSTNKICDYIVNGGNNILIGTDAHRYNELLDNIEEAEHIASELNLKPVIYQKRKRIII